MSGHCKMVVGLILNLTLPYLTLGLHLPYYPSLCFFKKEELVQSLTERIQWYCQNRDRCQILLFRHRAVPNAMQHALITCERPHSPEYCARRPLRCRNGII